MRIKYFILAIILLVVWLAPYILIGIAISILIVLLTNGKSASNDEPENQLLNNKSASNQTNNAVASYTSKDYFEVSEQQGKKLQSVIDALIVMDEYYIYKIVNRLQSLYLDYWRKSSVYKSNLYDYILEAANERIGTAKRDFVKRECETVLQIVRLLKDEIATENIVRIVFPAKGNDVIEETAVTENTDTTDDFIQIQSDDLQNNSWEVVEKLDNHQLQDKEYCRQLHERAQVLHQNGHLDKEIDFIRETIQTYESAGLPCEYWDLLLKVRTTGSETSKQAVAINSLVISQIISGLLNNAICRDNTETNSNEEQFDDHNLLSPIIQQILSGLLNNAIRRENTETNSNEEQFNEHNLFSPVISQIISGLLNNAICRENTKANSNKEQFDEHNFCSNNIRIGIDKESQTESADKNISGGITITSHKSTGISNNVCPTEGVPYWEHTYIYSVTDLRKANRIQKQFYHYFKAQFLQEHYLDIEDNSNYAFVLMFDLADDYKKHKDYKLLKHQLDTLSENYPVVAGYINRVLLQTVTAVNQEEAEYALQSYDKSLGQLCRWVTSDEIIEVQGIKLTRGNFYIGECFRLPDNIIQQEVLDHEVVFIGDCFCMPNNIIREDSYTFEYRGAYIYGSVLNPELPINDKEVFKNVFCSYTDMSPAWRHEYLMWLSGGKEPSEVSVEILLFYLYGCEIRMFIDPQTKKTERRNILVDIIQLHKSLNIESPKGDEWLLLRKLSDFIGCAIMKYFHNNISEFDAKSILNHSRIYQDCYISWKIAGRKALPPEVAFEIAYEIYDIEQLISLDYISIVRHYFIDRFTELYKNINVDFDAKTTQNKSICYCCNHGCFNSEKIDLYYEIDSLPSGLWMIYDAIENSYRYIESKFRSYNRAKERSGGNETIAAILSLPNEIDIKEMPMIQTLIANIESEMQSGPYLVKPIDWLLALWEYERKDEKSIYKEYADSIIGGLRRMGFDIVPDYVIDKKRFNFGDICVIYKNEEHHTVKPTTKYERTELFIKLASQIVHADKTTADDFVFVEQQLRSYNNTIGNHLHLTASIRWRFLSKKQPIDKQAQNVIAMLTNEQRTLMGNALIRLACINNDINPKRIDSLKKVLPLLGIDADNIHSQIHRLLTDKDGFAVIEKKSDIVEFTINDIPSPISRPAISNVIINPKKLRIFEQQTKVAQKLLSDIFVDEGDENPQNVASNKISSAWMDILKKLLTKERWERADIENECKVRSLMLGAVLEQINDFSYEKVNDAVVEDDGENIYVTLDYKEQLI